MKGPINIFLFKASGPNENFGEYLCKKVIAAMGFEQNNYCQSNRIPKNDKNLKYIMTGIGGFFNNGIYEAYFGEKINKWYIWGSGVDCEPSLKDKLPSNVIQNKCVITMLRGPLTKQWYNIEDDVLLGDPGYLASYFFKFQPEEKRNVFVQFYYDNAVGRRIDGVDVYLSALLRPDVDQNFINVCRNISNANIVLTGSMHIAVAAHSYGVPWAMVSKEHTDLANEWKWHDTLGCLGLCKEDIYIVNSVEEGLKWWNSVKHKIKLVTKEYQEKIIKAFPVIS